MVAGKKWEETKKVYSVICRPKISYGCQLYITGSPWILKKLDSIHKEGITIYTGALRTLPVESLYIEIYDLPLELKRD